MTEDAVVGSWKLVRIGVEMADTGQRVDLYGAKPVGRMILTESGYATYLITAGDRRVPTTESDRAGLFESMMAYTGTYRIEGDDKLITSVDASCIRVGLRASRSGSSSLMEASFPFDPACKLIRIFPVRSFTASSNGSVNEIGKGTLHMCLLCWKRS